MPTTGRRSTNRVPGTAPGWPSLARIFVGRWSSIPASPVAQGREPVVVSGSDSITARDVATILRDDIEHYDDVVRQYLERLYQLLLLVFPVGGVAVAALYQYEQYLILLLIPILTALAILAAASLTVEMYALAAHKYFLEESLTSLLRSYMPSGLRAASTVPWDDVGGSLVGGALANRALWTLFPFMVVAGGGLSIAAAWINLGHLWYWAAVAVPVSSALYALALASLAKAPSVYHSTLAGLRALRHGDERRVENLT